MFVGTLLAVGYGKFHKLAYYKYEESYLNRTGQTKRRNKVYYQP